jgi:hypothetical protein
VLEVDVLPIETEELGAAKAGVGEDAEQEAIALAPAWKVALPDVFSVDRGQQPGELALVEDIGKGLSLLRGPNDERRVSLDRLVLKQDRKKPLSAATVRAWLDGAGL